MDSELLRSFVTVAETGGFSAAGRILNRTQSAVSLQIKRLEEQLGEVLFERTSRSVALNRAGECLLPYARRILRLHEEARAVLGPRAESETLRFGIPDEPALSYLPDILGPFARARPDVQLEIVCDQSPVLVDKLQDGLLDLVLAIRHEPTPTGIPVCTQPLVWVAAEGLQLAPDRPVPLAVNPEGCVYRAQAIALLGQIGRGWRIVYTSQSPTGINLAVQAGLAVTIKAARSVPDGCRCLGETDGLPSPRPAAVELHCSPASRSPAVDEFADRVIDVILNDPETA